MHEVECVVIHAAGLAVRLLVRRTDHDGVRLGRVGSRYGRRLESERGGVMRQRVEESGERGIDRDLHGRSAHWHTLTWVRVRVGMRMRVAVGPTAAGAAGRHRHGLGHWWREWDLAC